MGTRFFFMADDLKTYAVRFFTHFGVPASDAAIAADVLVAADLRGVDSHGFIRLNSYYGSRLQRGVIDPLSPMVIERETPTTLRVNGATGLGQVVGYKTMLRVIEKARQVGVAMASVRNSNHYGIAGYYAMMALPHDMIGISFTNSQPLVAPTYGRTSILGTNPIAVAVPAGKERPFVLDMATSIVPIGRITVYDKAGKEIPLGWGINNSGQVTSTPAEVLKGGALMALGGTDLMRGYKGYGLSLWVDIFSAALSGASFLSAAGHNKEPERPADIGHFFTAMRIDAFRDPDEFKATMDAMIGELKTAPKAVDQERIFIAGEKEFELAERYAVSGVPLSAEVVKILQDTGVQVGVPFDVQPVSQVEV